MSDALISECGKYRYWLNRSSEMMFAEKGTALFVMLNPSTADAEQDDPTIRRCRGFAKSWGCNGIAVANLYALRATNPKQLWVEVNPIGPDNDYWLNSLLKEYGDAVCAWGANAKKDRVDKFIEIAEKTSARLWCLGKTKNGSPKHPLYIKSDQLLVPWDG